MSKSNKKSYFIRRFRLFLQRNYAVLIALPAVLFAGYYTLCIEPEQLRITEYTFCHEKVTPQLDGTVIALVTDIHYNTQRCQLWQKAIQAINRRSGVECILLGGDLITGSGKP